MSDIRKKFEDFAKTKSPVEPPNGWNAVAINGEYYNSHLRINFEYFQAAYQSRQAEIDRLTAELETVRKDYKHVIGQRDNWRRTALSHRYDGKEASK